MRIWSAGGAVAEHGGGRLSVLVGVVEPLSFHLGRGWGVRVGIGREGGREGGREETYNYIQVALLYY